MLGPDPRNVQAGEATGVPRADSAGTPAAGPLASSGSGRGAGWTPLAPGERLESFEIIEAIGAGGMAAVYLANDTRLERLVALKVLPPEQAADPETVRRFAQEGRAAARLDHGNIARVYALGFDKGFHFIAFEYVEGTTLRRRVEQLGPLPPAEAVDFAIQVCEALVHASARGVVHRDIKPSNIIVTPQGRVKVVDMGLARRFERRGDDGLTQSGTTLGTFDYISPEQARDPRDVDVRSDLYSLGCTLFHVLAGRPPFPDGTVLQKLLQHQEEPAPDVRSANPDVPAELATILRKLMAKDRERRYQTPELLRADLLAVAADLGVHPDVASPHAPPPRPWERHLVWAMPAAGLLLVVAALVFWGQPPESVAQRSQGSPASPPHIDAPPAQGGAPASRPTAPTQAQAADPPAPTRRSFTVGASQDLADILARAPDGSTIVLSDDGPYLLPLHAGSGGDDATPPRPSRDLTIRAGPGARPILRVKTGSGEPAAFGALLAFRGGHVRLEGLEFQVEAAERRGAQAAIAARDAELSVTRCVFRRVGARRGTADGIGLDLRYDPSAEPPPLRVVATAFDAGLIGIRARGPCDLNVRDGLFGPGAPAVWLDNGGAERLVPAQLTVRRSSIMAGDGPVLRLEGTDARVAVESAVVAAVGDGSATLVATDDPDHLDWSGRDNLYGRLAAYLRPTGASDTRPPIVGYAGWADGPDAIRELRGTATMAPVWVLEDPRPLLARSDPALAFQIATLATSAGARQGPRGAVPRLGNALAGLLGPAFEAQRWNQGSRTRPDPGTEARRAPASDHQPDGRDEESPLTRPTATTAHVGHPEPATIPRTDSQSPGTSRATVADTTSDAADQPMVQMPPTMPDEADPDLPEETGDRPDPTTGAAARDPEGAPRPTSEAANPPTGGESTSSRRPAGRPERDEPSPVRSAEGLRRALAELSGRGGVIRLAAGARIETSSLGIPRGGRCVIQGETGPARPRLIFRPSLGGDAAPLSLFELAAGAALELQDLDLVLPAAPSVLVDRREAFRIGPGSDLVLARTTVTITGRATGGGTTSSAVVRVRGGGDSEAAEPATSTVRVENSLLRGDGDLLDVAAGLRLDLTVADSILCVAGTVVHGHGRPRGGSAGTLKLGIRQSTARAAGGLVRLQGAPGEPELPTAEVVVRDAILATTADGEPLLRIEAREGLDELRGNVDWEGHGVVYHRIETYRQDDSALSGTAALSFRRSSWQAAVGPREDAPFHGDARFLRPWTSDRTPWTATPDDFRLAPDSPVPAAGPRIDRIPNPPDTVMP